MSKKSLGLEFIILYSNQLIVFIACNSFFLVYMLCLWYMVIFAVVLLGLVWS